MDVRSLLQALRDEVKLTTTEGDAEGITRAITALRDFSESHRRSVVQLRLNQESVTRNQASVNKAENELNTYLNKDYVLANRK